MILRRPSGNLLSGTQRLPQNRHQIVFFERNGLRHGEFPINTDGNPKYRVRELFWSQDSQILAIWSESEEESEGVKSKSKNFLSKIFSSC